MPTVMVLEGDIQGLMGGKAGGVRSSQGSSLGSAEELAREGDSDGKVSGPGEGLSPKSGWGWCIRQVVMIRKGGRSLLELTYLWILGVWGNSASW